MNNPVLTYTLAALLTASLFFGLMSFGPSAQAEETSKSKTSDPMQFARGAKTWADNCVRCHSMRDPRELRDDQWRAVVSHMRIRGNLTGQEARDVLAFLQGSN